MKIIIAPNAFKGSLSASNAAKAIHRGMLSSGLNAEYKLIPVSDGGDGLTEILTESLQGRLLKSKTIDPLGRPIVAEYGWVEKTRTAIVELANAAGMKLLKREELNPLRTTTFGTGLMLMNAIEMGANEIFLGLGGSATVDGGSGIIKALGGKFFDQQGNPILTEGAMGLELLTHLDLSELSLLLKNVRITLVCDVSNPLLGEYGAARVFAPQKGADGNMIELLEKLLTRFAEVIEKTTGKNPSELLHGGAAGGTAAGLISLLNARVVSGSQFMAEQTGFTNEIKNADLVITGEGSLDEQTLSGKGPMGIAKIAKENHVPVIAFCGKIPVTRLDVYHEHFKEFFSIGSPTITEEESIRNAEKLLEQSAKRIGRKLKDRIK